MININNKPWSKLRSTDIQKFLSGTEDENFFFEFKADEETPAKLVKEISAFANTYALRSAYDIIVTKDGDKEKFMVILNTLTNLYEASKPEIFEKNWSNEKFAPLVYLHGLFYHTIDDEKVARARQKMNQILDGSVTASQDFVNYVRKEPAQHMIKGTKASSLYDTVAQAMSGIVYAAEKKEISVSVNCPEELMLSHDSKWTVEALFNLLDNAVKYTSVGGKISVSVVQWEMYVEIKVADNGKGISESNQAAIFRRFYREEEVHSKPGVGIGLYLTREIITRQGGYIKVVSVPGNGSEFSIMLPAK